METEAKENPEKTETAATGNLVEIYEKMSKVLRENLEKAGTLTEEIFEKALKESRDLTSKMKEHYSDDIGKVSEFIRRDWHDAIRQTTEKTKKSLDLERIQVGIIGVLSRLAQSAGAYLASARLLEKCEAEMGPSGAGIAVDERISAYALSIQNYFKGGDVEHARANLDKFKRAFPDNDLYYPDGTSFTVTMEAVLGRREVWTFGEFAALNVNRTLKSEMRRLHYWKNK